jgi:hypothetical protein
MAAPDGPDGNDWSLPVHQAAGTGQRVKQACAGPPGQHGAPMATQTEPAPQLPLLVQGVSAPQELSNVVTHTTLPSALRLQRQSTPAPGFEPHTVGRLPLGHNCVVLAGQVLLGKHEPAWQT